MTRHCPGGRRLLLRATLCCVLTGCAREDPRPPSSLPCGRTP